MKKLVMFAALAASAGACGRLIETRIEKSNRRLERPCTVAGAALISISSGRSRAGELMETLSAPLSRRCPGAG